MKQNRTEQNRKLLRFVHMLKDAYLSQSFLHLSDYLKRESLRRLMKGSIQLSRRLRSRDPQNIGNILDRSKNG